MRCNTCGDYIARGKKFNARKEMVENEEYLGLKVFRFYFKCPRCMQEITFKTDPQNYDYTVEHGATPNFKALKLAEKQAIEEQKEKEEEERLNPMKLLENRTKASRREMENLEALEDLKEMNQREVVIDYEELLRKKKEELEMELKRQEEEDEQFVRSVFSNSDMNDVNLTNNDTAGEDEIVEEYDLEIAKTDVNQSKSTTISSSSSFQIKSKESCLKTFSNESSESIRDSDKKEIPNKKRKLLLNGSIVVRKKPPLTRQDNGDEKIEKLSKDNKSSTIKSSLIDYSDSEDECN